MTGGAGFIGTKLCSKFYKHNKILLFDSLRRNSIGSTSLLDEGNVDLVQGDILDLEYLKETVAEFEPDFVIHLAAIAGIDTVIKDPTATMKVNMIGTFNILEALRPFVDRIERFIDFSTSEVFGSYAYKAEETHSTNLAPVGEARWTYSVSKLAGEHLTHSYHCQYGLRAVTVRPFNVYGPGQVGEGAIHHFVIKAIMNDPLVIHGEGNQIRSWCFVDDMVDGIVLCLEREEATGEVFNIGNPRGTTTILGLAEKVIRLANSSSQIIYVPKSYVDVELRIPSIDKAKELLGFEPKVDLNAGLIETIEWYRRKIERA